MPTRNVNLTDHYDDLIGKLVSTGRFKNFSEAVRAGLHLLEREEQTYEMKLEALRREAEIGRQAYEDGDYTVLEDSQALGEFLDDIDAEARGR